MTKRFDRSPAALFIYTVLLLFFFQLLTEFIAAVYAFGLLGTSIPPEIAAVLFLFSPVLLLFWRKDLGRWPFLALALVMMASRLTAVLLDTRMRMLVAGVGVAAGLLWFPVLLWRLARQEKRQAIVPLTLGLLGSVLLAALFRVWGSGSDMSTIGAFQGIGWLLALVTAVLLLRQPAARAVTHERHVSQSRLSALALGITSAFLLLYFAFISPNVIARWTGTSYPAIVVTMMLALAGFAGITVFKPNWLAQVRGSLLWGWNSLFVLSLVATILPYQTRFPANLSAYPLYETAVPAWQTVPLTFMLLLFPVIFVDFALFAGEIVAIRPSLRALGGAFAISALYLLLLILSHIFTTVYDYIPIVGPFFRDRFWLVYLVPGVGLLLPLLAVRVRPNWGQPFRAWAGAVWGLAVLAVTAVFLTMPHPADPPAETAVRVLTYNIQQGYSEGGSKNYAGQLALMRDVNADVIGLQESDTNRIAGGNTDVVRYFADALDMYAYYGPKTVPGTFGIALLSKYPIENPRTFYMFSAGEQTAAIEAQITVDGRSLHLFVTHLGNGGPLVQQQAVLQAVQGKGPLILMGDFNFRPDSEQYQLTTAVLQDAWRQNALTNNGANSPEPAKRIDHIFISPDLQVLDMRYILDPASDHPAATARFTVP